jgi:hypothetical protein
LLRSLFLSSGWVVMQKIDLNCLLMNDATNETRHAKYLQFDDESHVVDL